MMQWIQGLYLLSWIMINIWPNDKSSLSFKVEQFMQTSIITLHGYVRSLRSLYMCEPHWWLEIIYHHINCFVLWEKKVREREREIAKMRAPIFFILVLCMCSRVRDVKAEAVVNVQDYQFPNIQIPPLSPCGNGLSPPLCTPQQHPNRPQYPSSPEHKNC